ncbi:MAG: hydantoinase/oxoprolinase family protein, partial [Bacillota bacterium]|nr:hydantoinase/oxoprolinase family protein [Bacillota bacterium]
MSYRLGIDVGGTNTDAVLLDDQDRVLAKAKTPNSEDIIAGIDQVVRTVLSQGKIQPEDIHYVMLGTTQVTNAIIERRGLSRVGILRLGAPATMAIPPLAAWPRDLVAKVEGPVAFLPGGVEYDGRAITAFDEKAVREAVEKMAPEVEAFAVTSVFAPVKDEDELRAAEIIQEVVGEHSMVSISSQVGSIGFLERENATILNAAVTALARAVTGAFARALSDLGIQASIYLAQNDGTLMSLDYALRYPILTIASGPTNSIRGAAYLTGLQDAIVVDVGGTSTDVGILVGGFPRESSAAAEIGGVRTNFRMPDLISIGLGGGSRVRKEGDDLQVGPDSVGSHIVQEALSFGGSTLTMTDVVVALGRYSLGTVAPRVDRDIAENAQGRAKAMAEEAIDRIKTSAEAMPVIVVGGGSIILPDNLEGAKEVLRPPHFEVANAIGAAIAQVSGTIDRIFSMENRARQEVLDEARQLAFDNA